MNSQEQLQGKHFAPPADRDASARLTLISRGIAAGIILGVIIWLFLHYILHITTLGVEIAVCCAIIISIIFTRKLSGQYVSELYMEEDALRLVYLNNRNAPEKVVPYSSLSFRYGVERSKYMDPVAKVNFYKGDVMVGRIDTAKWPEEMLQEVMDALAGTGVERRPG